MTDRLLRHAVADSALRFSFQGGEYQGKIDLDLAGDAGAPAGANLVAVSQSGTVKKATLTEIETFANAGSPQRMLLTAKILTHNIGQGTFQYFLTKENVPIVVSVGFIMPRSGSLVGCSGCYSIENASADPKPDFSLRMFINDSMRWESEIEAEVANGNDKVFSTTQAAGLDTFSAGGYISLRVFQSVADASFDLKNAIFLIEVEYS